MSDEKELASGAEGLKDGIGEMKQDLAKAQGQGFS